MKKIFLGILAVAGILLSSCSSKDSKAEFYVRGNCGMCQERIETTLKGTKGVSSATWNVESKMASVSYDSTVISAAKLEEVVANAGHETKKATTPAAVHDALPECCKKGNSM
jgi:Cu(I)/Ag(I) efflux system membrane fusion protein